MEVVKLLGRGVLGNSPPSQLDPWQYGRWKKEIREKCCVDTQKKTKKKQTNCTFQDYCQTDIPIIFLEADNTILQTERIAT